MLPQSHADMTVAEISAANFVGTSSGRFRKIR